MLRVLMWWFASLLLDAGGDGGGDGGGGDGGPPPPDAEEVKNPRIRELSREAANWRTKFRQAEARIKELEGNDGNPPPDPKPDEDGAAQRSSALESAFLRGMLARQADGAHINVEDAWDLFNLRKFAETVKDPSDAEAMTKAIDALLDRYPWLADGDADSSRDRSADAPPPPAVRGARKKKDHNAVDRADLHKRFPAISRRTH